MTMRRQRRSRSDGASPAKAKAKAKPTTKVPGLHWAATLPVLAVDPALDCGWAIYDIGGNLTDSGVVGKVLHESGYSSTSAPGVWAVVAGMVKAHGRFLLVVENQYPRPVAQDALFREIEARGAWEFATLLHGCEIARVMPSTWQSVEGITGERNERKKQAKVLAGVSNDNEADAILLGRYALRMARIKAAR